jgi:hypothetical protein
MLPMEISGSCSSNTMLDVAINIPTRAISGRLRVAYIKRAAASITNTSKTEVFRHAIPKIKPKPHPANIWNCRLLGMNTLIMVCLIDVIAISGESSGRKWFLSKGDLIILNKIFLGHLTIRAVFVPFLLSLSFLHH